MTATYEDYHTTSTFTEAFTYWTSTQSEDESNLKAYVLKIEDLKRALVVLEKALKAYNAR